MAIARMIYFDAVLDIDVRSVKYGRSPPPPLPSPNLRTHVKVVWAERQMYDNQKFTEM